MTNDVEEIKDKIDIADLMSEYIKLIPAGANFKALCPFHNEKTPSMIISPDKKIFKCFGCGVGGDVFEFIMKIEGLEFVEAKKVLAKKAGVALQNYDNKSGGKKEGLIRVMEMANKYYHFILQNSDLAKSARQYLSSRGLSESAIENWQIGYSPDSWSSLYEFLHKREFSDQDMFDAGLIQKKKIGSGFYDRFRGRIMFPIKDISGNTVAFTARVSPEKEATEKMGKYINSPQTDIYDKSRIVFALDKAKINIKSEDEAVIVEGQMDAITAHENGFKNVVASSGTALTLDQFKLIKRYTNNFLFALDADFAGQNAIDKGDALAKALDLYVVESEDSRGRKHSYVDSNQSYNISVKVVEIKGAKDPDELIRKSIESWKEAIKNAKPVIEYYFDKAILGIDTSNVSHQLGVVRALLPKIIKLNNRVEIDYWIKRLAQKLSISEDILREETAKVSMSNIDTKYNKISRNELVGVKSPKDIQLFCIILAVIMRYPKLLSKIKDELSIDYLYSDLALDLYKRLMLFYTDNVDSNLESSVDNSKVDLHQLLKVHLLEDDGVNGEVINLLDESFLLSENDLSNLEEMEIISELDKAVVVLKKDYINQKVNQLNTQLQEAEKRSDQEMINNLSRELVQLLKQKDLK